MFQYKIQKYECASQPAESHKAVSFHTSQSPLMISCLVISCLMNVFDNKLDCAPKIRPG